MSIIWDDKLKTNIPIIDDQHKAIINLVSGIKTTKLSKSEIYTLLSELQDFANTHFDTEEKYMREANYPEYENHKATHDQVRQNYIEIITKHDVDYSPSDVALEVINYIQQWFLVHYKNEDVKMAEYLKKNVSENS